MADTGETLLMLGEIRGELKGINKRLDKVDAIDTRLRKVERQSAINGAVAGGIISTGVVVLSESLKAAFKAHGA